MKISVVIPVYNTEKYLSRCLDSILSQNLQDFEIIVVNDKSPDNSLQLLEEYKIRDNRIRLVTNEKNMGLMWTRREGYRIAKGDYIIFCDSDDYMPENALEILYNAAVLNKTDIVIATHTYIKSSGRKIQNHNGNNRVLSQEQTYKELLNQSIPHVLWAKIFSRKLFDDFEYATFENHTNGEDMILFYQLVHNVDRVAVICDSVYYYCQNFESSTRTKFTERDFIILVKNTNWLYEYLKNRLQYKDLLKTRIFYFIYLFLKIGIPRNILFQINSDILALCKFSILKKYLGGYKAMSFILFYYIPFFSILYKMIHRLYRYSEKFFQN